MKNLVALAAFSAAAFAQPVMAEERAPAQVSQIVRYADLDLRSDSGRSRLDHRIRVAIQGVCGTASQADLEGKNEVRKCRISARERVADYRDIAIAAAESRSSTAIALRREGSRVTAGAAAN